MSDTVRVAANEAEQVLFAVACMDSDLNLREGQVADAARAIDAFKVAHAALIRAEERARCIAVVEGVTRYRGIKQSLKRNGDMVVERWPADEEKHRYCATVLDRYEVLAALTGADK